MSIIVVFAYLLCGIYMFENALAQNDVYLKMV